MNTALANTELNNFGYEQKLSRTLNTWQLVSFGLMYLQPIGPAVVFGFLLTMSKGTVALPYLFAFAGMIFTVISYSTLIKEYPLSGSIYNYAKMILGPFWGFMAGWLLALDYILIPTITSASASIYAHQLIPAISYEGWLIIFVLSMGLVNLIGIKLSSFVGSLILLVQIAVVLLGFAIWINYIVGDVHSVSSLLSLKPFHFDSMNGVLQASAIAIFGFLGFDAVSTLAEETVNPRKDIPKAMLICTCLGFGIMFITGYLGVLATPNWQQLSMDANWASVALFELAKLAGGDIFAFIYTVGFILAMMICNLVGTTAVSRLLYGMGRDRIIPYKIFGVVNKRWKTPHGNIIFIILLEIIFGSFVNIEQLAELINYGAIAGFILLNICVICFGHRLLANKMEIKFYKPQEKGMKFRFFVFPLVALIIMGFIFVGLKRGTLIVGSLWAICGIVYYYLFFRLSVALKFTCVKNLMNDYSNIK